MVHGKVKALESELEKQRQLIAKLIQDRLADSKVIDDLTKRIEFLEEKAKGSANDKENEPLMRKYLKTR